MEIKPLSAPIAPWADIVDDEDFEPLEVGMQPPTACHMPTLLTSTKPANQQNADKESRADEGWLDDDESGSEEKGPSEDYTFFGIDFKPVLPACLAVSTVIGGLCMLLVQIPMLSRFTKLWQVSNAMYGSYKPAVQVGMQPPTACHMPTLLTSTKPANQQNADKESRADEGWLDDDESGSEEKGPSEDYTFFGIDFKPVLPACLAVSTVIGGLCMLLVQIPMLSRFTKLWQVLLSAPFVVIYGIVLGCMAYCAYADPGQVKQTQKMKIGAVGGMDIEEGIPRRAHKSWQYSHPIRRYDHYCKWLKNVVGLLNHREFVIMVAGLLLIGVLGIMVDIWLAILIAEKGLFKFEIVVALHLGYSVALLAIDWPIFKIHFGLISRNEMA
eukprot:symbB.v1.2.036153.t1/scaffold5038.1/size31584/1